HHEAAAVEERQEREGAAAARRVDAQAERAAGAVDRAVLAARDRRAAQPLLGALLVAQPRLGDAQRVRRRQAGHEVQDVLDLRIDGHSYFLPLRQLVFHLGRVDRLLLAEARA